ncbi:MAG: histidine phosphatase family protein [Acidimicrobiia bacterium]|nr:histidine phosphatase family protein [Acidimicrobiia bacterium]MYC57820.1 histidine phosphatase family protein [Acidimicrobiia bacterium]MYI29821.1 histidine phosphatase family protein [Acidimicrobiia bacterium]
MSQELPTRLLLIRHGESEVTVKQIIGGDQSCTGLSVLGRQQAEALGRRWAEGHEPKVDALWSSTLPRAYQTAELLAASLGDLKVQMHPDLVERRPGQADGVSFSEFTDQFEWTGDVHPYVPLAPGGESQSDFFHRTGKALYELVHSNPGTTMMVVCHGGVIDVAMRVLLGLAPAAPFLLWTLNTSITEFLTTDKIGVWRLVRYNDSSHLSGLPTHTDYE